MFLCDAQCCDFIVELAALFGIFCAVILFLRGIYWTAYGIRVFVVARVWAKNFVDTYGKWAVVTGGSNGIGKQYALEFARRGMDVVIISENQSDLEKTELEIKEKFGVTVKIILADLSQGQTVYSTIEHEIKDMEIGILVNNVGVAPNRPMYYTQMNKDLIWRQILINIGSVSHMTHIVLPQMMKRRSGAVINVSSASGFASCWPLMSVYGASKSYVKYLTHCLEHEHKRYGITVQCVLPFFVDTTITGDDVMTVMKRVSFVPSAETFVRSAVATLGHTSCTTGHWLHGLQYLALFVLCIKSLQISYVTFISRYIRRRTLSRAAACTTK